MKIASPLRRCTSARRGPGPGARPRRDRDLYLPHQGEAQAAGPGLALSAGRGGRDGNRKRQSGTARAVRRIARRRASQELRQCHRHPVGRPHPVRGRTRRPAAISARRHPARAALHPRRQRLFRVRRRLLLARRQHPVRQRPDPGHHLRDHRPLAPPQPAPGLSLPPRIAVAPPPARPRRRPPRPSPARRGTALTKIRATRRLLQRSARGRPRRKQ